MRPKSVTCGGGGGGGGGERTIGADIECTHKRPLAHLESSTPPVIPNEGVLVQLSGSAVDEVSAALLQERVVGQLLLTHTIQRGVAQHADIQVSVPCT